jgi:nucleoside-diphosphate-sugar epimerase
MAAAADAHSLRFHPRARPQPPWPARAQSETVPGFHFPQFMYPGSGRGEGKEGMSSGGGLGGSGGLGGVGGSPAIPGSLPLYCPTDEEHPILPHDPYALSKHFGEQLCDAAVRRRCGDPGAPISIVSIRPSWCQDAGNIARNLGPLIKDPSLPQAGMWAYICIADLADAIVRAASVEGLVGHEVVYIAAADNIGGRDLAAAVKAEYGDAVPVRPLARPDASGITCAKAQRLLGWTPRLTWRDFLTEQGDLKAGVV